MLNGCNITRCFSSDAGWYVLGCADPQASDLMPFIRLDAFASVYFEFRLRPRVDPYSSGDGDQENNVCVVMGSTVVTWLWLHPVSVICGLATGVLEAVFGRATRYTV